VQIVDNRKEFRGIVTEVQGRLREQGVFISLQAVSKRITVGTDIGTMRFWIEAIKKRKAENQVRDQELNELRKEAMQ
jgi:hypothetical protein